MTIVNPDLTQVSVRRCAKCNSTSGIIRHHMGNDRFLGQYDESIKRNYKRYLYCIELCVTCHAIIHTIYDAFLVLSLTPAQWLDEKKARKAVRKFRMKYIKLCNEWLVSTKYDKDFNKDTPAVQQLLGAWFSSEYYRNRNDNANS